MTESAGPAAATEGPEESLVYGSTGRIGFNLEAQIVDPSSGQSLPPGQRGELWLRGPTIMKGMKFWTHPSLHVHYRSN